MMLVVTMLVLGAALLFLEVFLPGWVAGVAGVLCLAVGVVAAFQAFGTGGGLVTLTGVVVGVAIGFWAWLRYFPDSRAAAPFISKSAVGDIGGERPELLGTTGTTASALGPSGAALIGGERIDVMAETGWIDKGTPVEVVRVEGTRIVVRAKR